MNYIHRKMELYFAAYTPALDYFKCDFMDISKTYVHSLTALDLASIPPGKNNKVDISIHYLDLSSQLESKEQLQEYDKQMECILLYKNIVDLTLKRLCQEYEDRFFSSTSAYYNADVNILQKRIAVFMKLWLNVCFRLPNFSKWYIFRRVVNLMFEKNIYSGSLSWTLIEVACFNETCLSKIFVNNYPNEIELIIRNIRGIDSVNHNAILDLMCIHHVLKHGSVEVLTCLIKLGHEYEFENVLDKPNSTFWWCLFLVQKEHLLRIKPENMSLRRFMIMVHIYVYAEFFHGPREDTYRHFKEKLDLLYMVLPDPVITKEEVETTFGVRLKKFLPSARETISKRLDTITEKSHKPRNLEHLARCAVRKALNCNRMLPDGIKELPLPKRFQLDLMLEL